MVLPCHAWRDSQGACRQTGTYLGTTGDYSAERQFYSFQQIQVVIVWLWKVGYCITIVISICYAKAWPTFKQRVAGSIPARPTMHFKGLWMHSISPFSLGQQRDRFVRDWASPGDREGAARAGLCGPNGADAWAVLLSVKLKRRHAMK